MLIIHAEDFGLNQRDNLKTQCLYKALHFSSIFPRDVPRKRKVRRGRQHVMAEDTLAVSDNALGQDDRL